MKLPPENRRTLPLLQMQRHAGLCDSLPVGSPPPKAPSRQSASMTRREKRLRLIRSILWNDWDPIGVNASSEGTDEYDSDAIGILRKLLDGKNARELDRHLHTLEITSMGLPEHASEERAVAVQKLVALGNSFNH